MFPICVNERTGETIPSTRVSKYNGLIFKITPSRKNPNVNHCQIEGSLHTYFNNGINNANDFKLSDVCNIVDNLNNDYNVLPTAKISNIEFGVNIEIPVPVSKLLKMVVCMPNKPFTLMNKKKIETGLECAGKEHQYKIYNKGLQAETEIKNLLRVEISVKTMRVLTEYDIKTLKDLTDKTKAGKLINYILKTFSDTIIIDPSIYKNQITEKDRNRLKNYENPRFWQSQNKSNRYKHRIQLETILNKYNGQKLKETISKLIYEKWNYMLNEQPKTGDLFTMFSDQKQHLKQATFSPLECRVKKSLIVSKKIHEKKVCKICGKNIENQRKNSLYCSEAIFGKNGKKCRNKASGKKRTERQRLKRELEHKQLKRLQSIKISNQYKICRLTTTAGTVTEYNLSQMIFAPNQILHINKIILTGNRQPIELTTRRAKEFLKIISIINQTSKIKHYESINRKSKRSEISNRNKSNCIVPN